MKPSEIKSNPQVGDIVSVKSKEGINIKAGEFKEITRNGELKTFRVIKENYPQYTMVEITSRDINIIQTHKDNIKLEERIIQPKQERAPRKESLLNKKLTFSPDDF